MPKCINCGTDLEDSVKFCPICGKQQGVSTAAENQNPEPEQAESKESAQAQSINPPPQTTYPPQGPTPPPQGTYPPPQGYRPPQGTYPPPPQGYRPPQGTYPPPQGAYQPPPQGYRPPQGAYVPPQYQYQQPYYQRPVLNGNANGMLAWGIVNIVLSALCCWGFFLGLVPSIIAVVYANKAKSSLNQLDYDKAAKVSLILNIVATAMLLLTIIGWSVFTAGIGNPYWFSGN
ncbi:MAG: hypothetical protein BGN88_02605 [Clostridiales bacterium 43-6]|nr:MAG: hypothetical protein BGN88_02605 [Clostridiales bacterium 43-6]